MSPDGSPGKRVAGMASHGEPSLRENHTLPSSVPAQRNPGRTYDSARATTVPYVSAPVASSVMPPVFFMLVSILPISRLDRSGEIGKRLSPHCVLFRTLLPPM